MAFTRIRLWLRSFLSSQETREGRERIRRVRPRLEVLEDRTLPATFNPADATGLADAFSYANANPNEQVLINLDAQYS